jgi:hypothetical protein
MRWLWKLLGLQADVKAASKGPGAYARRMVRKRAHRAVNRL